MPSHYRSLSKSPLTGRLLSATLLALAAESAHAAVLDTTADFHVTVTGDQNNAKGEILVSDLLLQDNNNNESPTASFDEGIAVTGLGQGSGTWSYRTSGSNIWTEIGTEATPVGSNGNIILLPGTATLRFVPTDVNFNHSISAYSGAVGLTFVTADYVSANHATGPSTVSTVLQNGQVILSDYTGTYVGKVTLNRAPTPRDQTLTINGTPIVEVDASEGIQQKITLSTATTGLTIDKLINDPDALAFYGIAVSSTSEGFSNSNNNVLTITSGSVAAISPSAIGVWHLSYDNGEGTTDLPFSVDANSDTQWLGGSTLSVPTLRFELTAPPESIDPDNIPSITFKAWDLTNEGTDFSDPQTENTGVFSSGNILLPLPSFASLLGPASAFSSESATLSIELNHAPVIHYTSASLSPDTVVLSGDFLNPDPVLLTHTAPRYAGVPMVGHAPVVTDNSPVPYTVADLQTASFASDMDMTDTLGILVTTDFVAVPNNSQTAAMTTAGASTDISTSAGTLWYSVDGGTTLVQVVQGRYIPTDAKFYLRPQNGDYAYSFSFKAWDGTDGVTAGSLHQGSPLPTGGGITAFSASDCTVSFSLNSTSALAWNNIHDIAVRRDKPVAVTVSARTSLNEHPDLNPTEGLPGGLQFLDNGNGTGLISGTLDSESPSSLFIDLIAHDSATLNGLTTSFNLIVVNGAFSVPRPSLPVATGNATPTYATLGLATPEAVDSFLAAIAGKDSTQVRAFAYSSTDQKYVELPTQPAEGLLNHALFVVTRVELPFSLDGTPSVMPTTLTLKPGWNFLTIPVLTADGNDSATSHPWSNFNLTDSSGANVANPADAIGTTGSNDLTTTRPYAWNGSSYTQVDTLTSGVGYWFKNNTTGDLNLTRQSANGNLDPFGAPIIALGAASAQAAATTSVAVTAVVDRGTPPNPPAESSASADSGSSSGCGLGSGVAGFGLLLLAGLRAALRRIQRSQRP